MKNIFKITIVLCLLHFQAIDLAAQTSNKNEIKTSLTKLFIPSLSLLIDSALVHNGMVNYRRLEIKAKESNLKSKRRYWTRNFGIQADSRYGTFNNFSTTSGSNSTINLASNTKQLNYNVGFYLKIPLFDIINRKSQIKKAKSELAQAKSLVKSQESELRESVIRYYEDLKLKQSLLELRASNLGNARVNMEMVGKEFKNGLIEISEYVRISDMTSRIAVEFEKAKSDFFVSKKLLENLVGFELK
jgi:outer membrane protein TolC